MRPALTRTRGGGIVSKSPSSACLPNRKAGEESTPQDRSVGSTNLSKRGCAEAMHLAKCLNTHAAKTELRPRTNGRFDHRLQRAALAKNACRARPVMDHSEAAVRVHQRP